MKKVLLILMLSFAGTIVFAQPGGKRFEERKEKIEALKVAFITKELNLTSEEAQKFWPVYNKFEEEMRSLRMNRRRERGDMKDAIEKMSEKELEEFIDSEIGFRQSELDILKKYHPQFKKVLPVSKVALLIRAEEDFKKELLKRIQEREGLRRGR
jgi:hypothetical protein